MGSEYPEGPDWWLASDGRWYPPELHPARAAGPRPLDALPVDPATGVDGPGPDAEPDGPAESEPVPAVPPSSGRPPVSDPGAVPVPPVPTGVGPSGPAGRGSSRRWLWVVLGALAAVVLVGGGFLLLGGDDDDESVSVTENTTLPATSAPPGSTAVPPTTAAPTTPPSSTSPPTSVAPTTTAAPSTTVAPELPFEPGNRAFEDGLTVVAGNLSAGVWMRSEPVGTCTWTRYSGPDGQPGQAIVTATDVTGRELLEIRPGDGAVRSQGCGGWTPFEAAGSQDVILDGAWVVGVEIAPGTYRARNPAPECVFARVSGFSGSDDTVAFGQSEGQSLTVDVLADDVGFKTYRCGPWEPVE